MRLVKFQVHNSGMNELHDYNCIRQESEAVSTLLDSACQANVVTISCSDTQANTVTISCSDTQAGKGEWLAQK